jgi:GNAT superfamily N-acetyltransferase
MHTSQPIDEHWHPDAGLGHLSIGAYPLSLQCVGGQHWCERIGRLRALVWAHEGVRIPDFEGAESPDIWLDSLDANSKHWVILHGQRLIAAGRWSHHELGTPFPDHEYFGDNIDFLKPIASLNRLVVLSDYRGMGIAKILDAARIMDAYHQGVASVIAVAVGQRRSNSLQRLGFELQMKFPNDHGLLIPHRPLFGLYSTVDKLITRSSAFLTTEIPSFSAK